MMGEFLLLMVFLDKFWFGPVGAALDARDKELRGKLALVKDNGSEVGAAPCDRAGAGLNCVCCGSEMHGGHKGTALRAGSRHRWRDAGSWRLG